MPRVVSILLASISIWFRSRLAIRMELIAPRHQVAVYKQSILRPDPSFSHLIAGSVCGSLDCARAGNKPWSSFSLVAEIQQFQSLRQIGTYKSG
jgi:hypothetical protein